MIPIQFLGTQLNYPVAVSVLAYCGEDTRTTCSLLYYINSSELSIVSPEFQNSGIFSSLQPENLRLRRAIRDVESASKDLRYPLIFDPQTSGGLLAGVPEEQARACVGELRNLGYTRTAIIGRVLPESDRLEPVRLLL